MSSRRLILIGALLLYCAAPAAAQSVKVTFHNGRVDVSAQNAPLRTILAEWSRVGGTKIVNADRVGGVPMTLELTDVPERNALDVLLRNVSYMAGPRYQTAASLSYFDSIMIVPTSGAAPQPAPAPIRPAIAGAAPTPQVPQIDPNDPEENPSTDLAPRPVGPVNGPRQRLFRRPDAQQGPGPGPVTGPGVIGGVVGPNGQPIQPDPDNDQPPPEDRPDQPPSNPFGVAPGSGSATPGVISPVPPPQQQRPARPNGDPDPEP